MDLALIQKKLKKDQCPYLILLHSDPNFIYLTGLKEISFAVLLIPMSGKPHLLVTALDQEKKVGGFKTKVIKKSLTLTLKSFSVKKLAYNPTNLTLAFYHKLKKIYPRVKFKDYSSFFLELRSIKTEVEINFLKKAAKLTDLALQQIISQLKSNQFNTENDLKLFLQQFALKYKTELSFPPIIASGKDNHNPHHQTSNKRLSPGFLLLDFGISYHNYCSDMTRMVYLGNPTQKEIEFYNFLLKIQTEAINSLNFGLSLSQVDKEVRNKLGKFSSYFIHSLGHGVGIEIHENPKVSPDSKDKVTLNQVFTIEPGVYFKKYGLRIEDTILMKSKPLILTKSRKELIIINSKKYIKNK